MLGMQEIKCLAQRHNAVPLASLKQANLRFQIQQVPKFHDVATVKPVLSGNLQKTKQKS